MMATCCRPHRYTFLEPAVTVNCPGSTALKTCGAVVCGQTRTGKSRGPAKRGIGTVAVLVGGAPQAVLVMPNVANNRIAAAREAGCCNSG